MSTTEARVIESVEEAPLPLQAVVDQLEAAGHAPADTREAIRTLVERGDLRVTMDWKLAKP